MPNFLTPIPQNSLGSVLGVTTERGIAIEKIWRSHVIGAGSTAEADTGFDLPSGGLVLDVWVKVLTPETTGATKTLDVGFLSSAGGDADGLIDGISVAAAGTVLPQFTITTGSDNDFLGAADTHTIGALLTGALIEGEDAAEGGDGFAYKAPLPLDGIGDKSVSYTRGSTFVEFRGHIYIRYIEFTS